MISTADGAITYLLLTQINSNKNACNIELLYIGDRWRINFLPIQRGLQVGEKRERFGLIKDRNGSEHSKRKQDIVVKVHKNVKGIVLVAVVALATSVAVLVVVKVGEELVVAEKSNTFSDSGSGRNSSCSCNSGIYL